MLQAIAGGEHGGAEAFFVRLAGALARAGVAQHLLVRRDRSWAAKLREQGLAPIELPFGGALDLTTGRRFAREVAAFRPDVVLTWMNRATRFCPRSSAARPFVHVARLGGYYDLKYYRACDHLIGNTADIVRYIQAQGWPAERSHHLPNFVDAAPLPPVPRATLQTPDDAALVVALGRLHENKALDILLRALADVPAAYAWIAGEGPLRAELEGLAAKLGVAQRVRFLGWRDDVGALLASADVFVCPSRIEPLGNVVIEAWAHGAPVVATASAGPGALIVPGETGLLVPVDDAEALTTSIRTLLDNPTLARRLAEAGRKAYEAEYTESAVVHRYLDFFRTISLSCAA